MSRCGVCKKNKSERFEIQPEIVIDYYGGLHRVPQRKRLVCGECYDKFVKFREALKDGSAFVNEKETSAPVEAPKNTAPQEKLGWLDWIFLLLGIRMLYGLLKGDSVFKVSLVPVGFAVGFVIILVVAGSFLWSVFFALSPLLIIIGLVYAGVRIHERYMKRSGRRHKLTDENLSKVYFIAMEDLMAGRIDEETFLRVAERVREHRMENHE